MLMDVEFLHAYTTLVIHNILRKGYVIVVLATNAFLPNPKCWYLVNYQSALIDPVVTANDLAVIILY